MINISIIIPVYNVEKYLSKCLDSIINQIKPTIEILLINDGSTDNSKYICEQYERKYEEVKLFNKVNGGLSDARNYGINNSKGKYLMFVDSDDFLEENNIEIILNMINKYPEFDVLMHSYNNYCEEDNESNKQNIFVNGGFTILNLNNKDKETIFENGVNIWPAWKNLVKKEFLESNGLYFKKGFLHEDVDWTTKILINANSIIYLNKPLYNYRINRVDSIMSSRGFDSIKDVAIIVRDLEQYMNNENIDKNLKSTVLDRLSRSFYTTLKFYKNCDKNQKLLLKDIFVNNNDIFKYSTLTKHKIFNIGIKILGVNNTIKMYSYMINISNKF